MKDKLNNFINFLNGQFVEISSSSALYQCMDLAYLFVLFLDVPKSTIQNASAYLVWTNASDFTRKYFDLIENKVETIPQAGDLFVIGKSSSYPYGHIGIVIEATQTTMKCFEQNYPTGTNAHIQDRKYTGVVGFLRPKVTLGSPLPSWLTTLLQEAGVSLDDEAKFRAFWDKAKRYDEDTRVLQEQVKSANETLAEKSIDVSNLTSDKQKLSSKVDELTELYNKAVTERNQLSSDNNILQSRVSVAQDSLDILKIDYSKLQNEYKDLSDKSVEALKWYQLITLTIRKIFGK